MEVHAGWMVSDQNAEQTYDGNLLMSSAPERKAGGRLAARAGLQTWFERNKTTRSAAGLFSETKQANIFNQVKDI